MVSSKTQSANELAKTLILVHRVQLKPTIKDEISGRMASIGISDVVTASCSTLGENLSEEVVDDDDENDNY